MAITLVNMMPQSWSDERHQDSEPNLTVNPMNPLEMVGSAFTLDTATGTAMVGSNGPVYVSTDGGDHWAINLIVPSSATFWSAEGDITVRFGGTSGKLYAGIIKAPFGPGNTPLQVLRTDDPTAMTPMTALDPITPGRDQPYVDAATVLGPAWSPDINKDRIYVPQNQASSNNAAIVDELLDAATVAPPAPFTNIQLDFRPPAYDNYQTRFATHQDGTTYGVFYKRLTSTSFGFTGEVVLVKDLSWGLGASPFQALIDTDSFAGIRIVPSLSCPRVFSNDPNFGRERYAGELAIAVDPRNSQRVYVAYATGTSAADYTLHVMYSTMGGGGTTWSGDVYPVPKGKNPGLAINSRGVVGLLYQKVVGAAGSSRWETHFVTSTNDFATAATDTLLANVPADGPNAPAPVGAPYIGDYACLQAVGKNFYGVFSANNYPDLTNFLPGVQYRRNVNWSTHQLLPTTGTTPVPISIDPFFFKVTDEDPGMDFYVRDWTDTPTSGDNGVEPSSHPDFFDYSDVWNQQTSSADAPDAATDRLLGAPTAYGAGTAGDNYAYARIRRNAAPGVTVPAATVSAHFMVSEFGVGSNYADAGTPDPSDPDVVISGPDVSVPFAAGATGPQITPAYPWHLDMTSSTHLCLAVEINTTGDAFAPPGLTGRAPGWPTSDLAVLYDNNKAQRNLQVYAGMTAGMVAYYGLAHNASTATRDMVLTYGATPDIERHLIEATVQVIETSGQTERLPFKTGSTITLRNMEPGENRWICVVARIGEAAKDPLPISFYEKVGNTAVNGFTIVAKPSPLQAVIDEAVDGHRVAFGRMAAAFKSAAGQAESDAAAHLQASGGEQPRARGCGRWIDWLARALHLRPASQGRTDTATTHVQPAVYNEFLRQHVPQVRQAVADLIGQQHVSDPFGVQSTIAELSAAVTAGDFTGAVSLHGVMLHQLDAFVTMLRKAQGDPADILQMVTWQKELYASLPGVKGTAFAAQIVDASEAFIAGYEARKVTNKDYPDLLAQLAPLFQQTDAAVGGQLDGDIAAMIAASESVRALQKAHRDYLMHLRQLAAAG